MYEEACEGVPEVVEPDVPELGEAQGAVENPFAEVIGVEPGAPLRSVGIRTRDYWQDGGNVEPTERQGRSEHHRIAARYL